MKIFEAFARNFKTAISIEIFKALTIPCLKSNIVYSTIYGVIFQNIIVDITIHEMGCFIKPML